LMREFYKEPLQQILMVPPGPWEMEWILAHLNTTTYPNQLPLINNKKGIFKKIPTLLPFTMQKTHFI
jgi:hypothetical protein